MPSDRRRYVRKAPPNLDTLFGPLEQRRGDIERIREFGIRPHRVHGFHEFTLDLADGALQCDIGEIDFPVWFVERPAFSFGAETVDEMLAEEIPELEYPPSVSVVVVGWKYALNERPGGGYYTGAKLAITASGRPGEAFLIHWQADGQALVYAGYTGVDF
jgi:hypothetical protein